MCNSCGHEVCKCQQPYVHNWLNGADCNPCTDQKVCKELFPAKCVIYHGPPLDNLGLGTDIDIEIILASLNSLIKPSNFIINNGQCIRFHQEFINGVKVYTPQIDLECLAAALAPIMCPLCGTSDPVCTAPTNVAVVNLASTNLTITWDMVQNTTYNVNINGQNYTNVTSPFDVTGLTASTTYTYTVQSNCSNGLHGTTNGTVSTPGVTSCPSSSNLQIN